MMIQFQSKLLSSRDLSTIYAFHMLINMFHSYSSFKANLGWPSLMKQDIPMEELHSCVLEEQPWVSTMLEL